MSRAAYFIFSTSGLVTAIAVAAIWLAVRPSSRAGRRALTAIAIAYSLASIYAIPTAIAGVLARPYRRFERSDIPPGRVALVIFGAGDEEVYGWDARVAIPNVTGAARVLEAVRVYGIAHPAWIISSGGNVSVDIDSEPSSVNMKDMLIGLGVEPGRIVLESSSRDSHDEAVMVAGMLRSLGADSAILVTSAVHMRRSIAACHEAGWAPLPAPAPDSWFQHGWIDWITPSNHGLYFSGEVVHELLGLPYYAVRGWIR